MIYKKILLSALLLTIVSTFIYKTDICCMFTATRYYGWPSSFISVSKTTETLDEAKKVDSEKLTNLLKDGWQVRFNADYIRRMGLSSIAVINLATNYLFYLGVAIIWTRILRRLQKG